jgi:signal transduction histidine kinase
MGGQMQSDYYEKLWRTIKIEKKTFENEITNRRKDGKVYTAKIVITPISDHKKNLIAFIGTEADITAFKLIEKAKDEVLSIAAHQLRTPLGITRWNFEELIDHIASIESALSHTYRSIRKMIDLVNNLLSISRLSSGKLFPEFKNTYIIPIIKQTIEELKDEANQKQITILFKTDVQKLQVKSDEQFFHVIISNLISNAIQYSNKNIKVILSESTSDFRITVQDYGIGVPKEEQDKIFHEFYRASNAAELSSGSGLGLYVVKSFVEKLKGTITFKSHLNKGTKFECIFPKL